MNSMGANKHESISYKDVLKEITTIGAGHAAAALSIIYNRPVYISVPEVDVIKVKELPKIRPSDSITAQSKIRISGDWKAYAFIVVKKSRIPILVSKLTGPTEYDITEEFIISVMSELSTMLFGGYFSALGNFLLQSVLFTPPVVEPIGNNLLKDIESKGLLPSDKILLAKSDVLIENDEKASLTLYTAYLLKTFHDMMPPLSK